MRRAHVGGAGARRRGRRRERRALLDLQTRLHRRVTFEPLAHERYVVERRHVGIVKSLHVCALLDQVGLEESAGAEGFDGA